MLNRSGRRNRWFFQIPLGIALLVLLTGSGLALAASDLPDGTPSNIQRAGERLRLTLTRDPLQRGELHLRFAERQLTRLDAGMAVDAGVAYQANLKAFGQVLEQAAGGRRPDPAWEDRIHGVLVGHQGQLEAALKRVPDSSADPLLGAWAQCLASQIDLLLFAADRRLEQMLEAAFSNRVTETNRVAEEYGGLMLGALGIQNVLLSEEGEASLTTAWASVDKLKKQAKRHSDRLIVAQDQMPPESLDAIQRGLAICAACGGGGGEEF